MTTTVVPPPIPYVVDCENCGEMNLINPVRDPGPQVCRRCRRLLPIRDTTPEATTQEIPSPSNAKAARYYEERGNEASIGFVMIMAGAVLSVFPPGLGLPLIWIGLACMIESFRDGRIGRRMNREAGRPSQARYTPAPTQPGGDGLYPQQARVPDHRDRPADYKTSPWTKGALKAAKYYWILYGIGIIIFIIRGIS